MDRIIFDAGNIFRKSVNWISLVQVIVTLDQNQGLDQINRRKNGLAIFVWGGIIRKKKE